MIKETTDLELLESKEFDKLAKLIGEKAAKDIAEKSPEELKELIAYNSVEIQKSTAEVKNHARYKAAVEVKKDMDKSLNEVIKPLKEVVKFATMALSGKQ